MSDGPWIKFYPADWLTGTRGMSAAEIGVYITLIAMMYEKGAAIVPDVSRLARACGIPAASFSRILDTLIETRKLTQTDVGLFNERVQSELATRQLASVTAANSARARWDKTQQNQQPENAPAMPTASSRARARNQKPDIRKDHPSDDSATLFGKPPATPREFLETVLDAKHADAVLDHRQRLRKPLSMRAAELMAQEFAKCSDPNEAADLMIAKAWTGFKADWWENERRGGSAPRAGPGGRRMTAQEQTRENLRDKIGDVLNRRTAADEGNGDIRIAGVISSTYRKTD